MTFRFKSSVTCVNTCCCTRKQFFRHFSQHTEYRQALDEAASRLQISSPDHWYRINTKDLVGFPNVQKVLKVFKSVPEAVMTCYPEYEWKFWKFERVPHHIGQDVNYQRQFFDTIAKELSITKPSDWYSVTYEDVASRGGAKILRKHDSSLCKALSAVYPNYDWKPWKFAKLPGNFWKDHNQVREYLFWLGQQYNIQTDQDWNNLSLEYIDRYSWFQNLGGIHKVIRTYFPEGYTQALLTLKGQHTPHHDAIQSRTTDSPAKSSKGKAFLIEAVKKLFPQLEGHENYSHPKLVYSETQKEMVLDLCIPSLSVAMEYVGEYHFVESFQQGSTEYKRKKLDEKRQACKREGITLIEIPFWWNRMSSSLVATILKHRPDLASYLQAPPKQDRDTPKSPLFESDAIPEQIPTQNLRSLKNLKNKQKAQVEKLLHYPEPWLEGTDITNKLLQPQHNGVRALWNANQKKMMNMFGTFEIEIAQDLKDYLPSLDLDVVLQNNNSRIVLVDCPTLCGVPYQNRIEEIKKAVKNHPSIVMAEDYILCQSKEDLLSRAAIMEETQEHLAFTLSPDRFFYHDYRPSLVLQNTHTEFALVTEHLSGNLMCKLYVMWFHFLTIRATGEQFTVRTNQPIQVGSVIQVAFSSMQDLSLPNVLSGSTGIPWADIESSLRLRYPFQVRLGKKTGAPPTCHGCFQTIPSKELRVSIQARFTSAGHVSHAASLFTCFNKQCLTKGIQHNHSKGKNPWNGLLVPSFKNELAFPAELANEIEQHQVQSEWHQVHWIKLH